MIAEPEPEAYDDVDAELLPLFEQPSEWFDSVLDHYYLSAGGVGTLVKLSPVGATFRRSHYKGYTEEFFETLCIEYENEDSIGDAVVHPSRNSVEQGQEQATWMEESGSWFKVFEHVPFNERVTDVESLQAELEEIMATTPDFAELFDAIESTCA